MQLSVELDPRRSGLKPRRTVPRFLVSTKAGSARSPAAGPSCPSTTTANAVRRIDRWSGSRLSGTTEVALGPTPEPIASSLSTVFSSSWVAGTDVPRHHDGHGTPSDLRAGPRGRLPGACRRQRGVGPSVSPKVLEDATLLVSELVSNASATRPARGFPRSSSG